MLDEFQPATFNTCFATSNQQEIMCVHTSIQYTRTNVPYILIRKVRQVCQESVFKRHPGQFSWQKELERKDWDPFKREAGRSLRWYKTCHEYVLIQAWCFVCRLMLSTLCTMSPKPPWLFWTHLEDVWLEHYFYPVEFLEGELYSTKQPIYLSVEFL